MSPIFEVSQFLNMAQNISHWHIVFTLWETIVNSSRDVINVNDNNPAHIFAQRDSHICLKAQLTDHELLTHMADGDVKTVPLCGSL